MLVSQRVDWQKYCTWITPRPKQSVGNLSENLNTNEQDYCIWAACYGYLVAFYPIFRAPMFLPLQHIMLYEWPSCSSHQPENFSLHKWVCTQDYILVWKGVSVCLCAQVGIACVLENWWIKNINLLHTLNGSFRQVWQSDLISRSENNHLAL